MAARPKNPEKRLMKLSAAAHLEEVQEFKKACATLRLQPAETLRELAHALAIAAGEHGHVVKPLRLVTTSK